MDAAPSSEMVLYRLHRRCQAQLTFAGMTFTLRWGLWSRVLSRLRDRLSGRIVIIYQPAEETLEGARAMIDAGVLRTTAPDEIYALYCAPLPVGQFAVMPGFGQAGLDQVQIDLDGQSAAVRSGSGLVRWRAFS